MMEERESIFRQPVSEILRKELSADFFRKELTLPGFLKKEISGGILDRDILFWRKQAEEPDDEIEQTTCFSCGKQTPATVSTCMHCSAHINATYAREYNQQRLLPSDGQTPDNDQEKSLIDKTDELF